MIKSPEAQKLREYVHVITVCPEKDIGLGVPRKPIRLIKPEDEVRLVQSETGEDITEKMAEYCENFLDMLPDADGFVLKNRSPTCGINAVKIYKSHGKSPVAGHTAGIFGQMIIDRFPFLAIEDEGRLNDIHIREHFFTKLFTLADFHQVEESGEMAKLVDFQARNKLLLLAYNQEKMRVLGKIAANHDKLPFDDIITDYANVLYEGLSKPYKIGPVINVLQHAFGYVSEKLSSREKEYFEISLENYREKKIPLSTIQTLMNSWIIRFEVEYLEQQSFFEPFPNELKDIKSP